MKSTTLILLFAITFVSLSSCNKTVINEQELKIETLGLDFKKIKSIKQSLNQSINFESSKNGDLRLNNLTNQPSQEVIDSIIQEVVLPLQLNGNEIYSQMLSQLVNTNDWNELSYDDKQMILNFDDGQKTQLSMIFSPDVIPTSSASSGNGINIADVVQSCIGFALGISGIKDIIIQTKALLTAKQAIQILKIVGKRYLSWVGIAWMIWDFTDCVTSAGF
ncbi:MAG: hypothetical protein LCH58_02135 [Bacteroidetes bacterium]|uniref:hypothetical protein n=1 Tax=Phnomibacter sp. TaxID=2836217 RepID=UPI002FDD9EA2|nr:hypothetical protein [Bacteroidota bacterium]